MTMIGFRCLNNRFSSVALTGTQNHPQIIEHDCFPFPTGLSLGHLAGKIKGLPPGSQAFTSKVPTDGEKQ